MIGAVHFDYSGCNVLVTGGTSGIGAAMAAAYRAAGAHVTITGTRGSAVDYDADLYGYRYLPMNLEQPAQIAAVAAALPALDILVNNAGTAFPDGLDESDPDIFSRALDINLASAYRLAAACRPLLEESRMAGGASVLGIASLTSLFGNPIVPGYGAAKAGLVQLTKSLAIGWARYGIRVNAVAAGLIETRLTASHVADREALAPWLARTPLGRVGKPDDIAGVALFLTSTAAAYVTGQCWVADGGYSVSG